MPITLSAEVFDRDAGQARRSTERGPVVIVDGGRPAQVLLSIADYRRLTGDDRSIADALAMTDADAYAFEPPRLDFGLRTADLD